MRAGVTKFSTMIRLDVRKIFRGSIMPLALAKFLQTRMLTRDLFAVANILVVKQL